MTRFLPVLSLIACLPAVQPLLAQPGSVDPMWNPIDVGYGSGEGATSGFGILTLAIQPDGKVVAGGSFTEYNTTNRNRIVRLNTDGSVDHTFDPGAGANWDVGALVLQPDGNILVGGDFMNFHGRQHLLRLQPNGQADNAFVPGNAPDQPVHAITLRADGKVMVAGQFNNIGGTYRPQVARLNSDGSPDLTFDAGLGTDMYVSDIVVQADDKVIIAGPFTEVNGTFSPGLARLHADGTLDATFTVGNGFFGQDVHALLLQPDGRLLVAGNFTTYNGIATPRLVRLMPDGSPDASFNTGSGFNDAVSALLLRDDGRIVAGGDFTQVDGAAHGRLVQLLADGSIDPTFAVGEGPNAIVRSLVEQADGKVVHGGQYFLHGTRHRMHSGRVHTNGTDDLLYNVATGATGSVQGLAEQPDGRILISGAFLSYNDTLAGRVVRVLPDGFVDTSFHAHSGVLSGNANIHDVVVQPDGRIVVGGSFGDYGSMPGNNVARLLPNGEVDTGFDVGTGTNNRVRAVAVQADGKVLIGGEFSQVGGTPRSRIARLNTDGSLDATFLSGSGFDAPVHVLAVQPDGKILVGGAFTTYNGNTARRLARLLPDGGLDPAFAHQNGVLGQVVYAIEVEPDGRILIGGNFTSYDLVSHAHLARLLPNGNVDPTFPSSLDLDAYVSGIGIQADGRIVIGGAFTEVAGVPRQHVARLNADGTFDPQFDPGAGPEGEFHGPVYRLLALSSGKVLIGGAFTRVDGIGRNHVARLFGGGSVDLGPAAEADAAEWAVHPVPSAGMVQLDPLPGAAMVEVLSPDGRMMGRHFFAQQLDLSAYPAGTYLLRVRNTTAGTLAVRRVVLSGR